MPKSGSRTSTILHTIHISGYSFDCDESNRQFKFSSKSMFDKMVRLHCSRCNSCSKCKLLDDTSFDKKRTARKMIQSNNWIDIENE